MFLGHGRVGPRSCECSELNRLSGPFWALALVDHVLPRAPYRQWTLSLPIRLRWALARDAALCSEVLSLFIRTLFNTLRARGRSLALPGREAGAVSFIQRFGSALQLNVHFHVLVPEGLFADDGAFHPLPPPEDTDVEALLHTFLRRLLPLLERHGLHELETLPEHALDSLQRSSAQWKLPLGSPHPPRRARRCATLEGFSLHANTRVHENDRLGLETLCRYGARGALSLQRLSRREDGTLAYRMKRPGPDGSTHLLLTPLELLRKLAALVPPPRFNLTRFHGVFASNSRLRARVVPVPPPTTSPPAHSPTPAQPPPPTSPRGRLPWAELLRRTFGLDLLTCHACGSARRVLAFISNLPTARRILHHLNLPSTPPHLPAAAGPPQLSSPLFPSSTPDDLRVPQRPGIRLLRAPDWRPLAAA